MRAGSEISFIARPIKHRSEAKYRALDIAITKCDPLPDPTGLHIGYTVISFLAIQANACTIGRVIRIRFVVSETVPKMPQIADHWLSV